MTLTIESGLLKQETTGEEKTASGSSLSETKGSITGDLSAKVFGIGASTEGRVEASSSETQVATRLVRGVQEKVLHDFAFDKIYDYLL